MDTLAFYLYPMPHGTRLHRDDLSRREQVLQLFDYCQILEAVISKQSWTFLIARYGYEELFHINQESGWLDCSTMAEFLDCVDAEIESSVNQL